MRLTQKQIDIGLAFMGAALGAASDLHQYGGKIGIGVIAGAVAFPALFEKARRLIEPSHTPSNQPK